MPLAPGAVEPVDEEAAAVGVEVAEVVAIEVKYLRFVGLDHVAGRYATEKMVAGVVRLVGEMGADPAHPLRVRFDEFVATLIGRLKDDPALRVKGEVLKAELLAHPALADYLHHGGYDKHLRRLRHALESQGAQLAAAVAQHFPAGVRISRPDGGYFLWVEFAPGFDTLALHQLALGQGISIAPGPIFSARRAFGHCIRLNFGHPFDARIASAVQTLGQLASAM